MNQTADMREDQTSGVVAEEPARAPEVAAKAQANTTDEQNNKPANEHDKSIDSAWHKVTDATTNLFATTRYHAVRKVPAPLVNYSSNFLGAAHVMTEMMMFKASLKDGKLFDPSEGAIYGRTIYPIKKVYSEIGKSARDSSVSVGELMRGNPIKNVYNYVTNTQAATTREIEHQLALGKPANKISLGNRWQTRSTLAGLVVWGLSAMIPDKKESDEEVERMEIMRRTNVVGYVGERLKQAVWVPGWFGDHKRQMIGAGILISGVCSTFGAWRNRDKLSAVPKYIFNGGYFGTAMLTLASAFPLLFASDDQRGFGGFGAIMTGRLFFLPKSIYNKFKAKEDGALWYTGATAGFQLENWAQALIGGAEKLPDGTIVDHQALHEEAKKKANALKQQKAEHPQHFADEAALPLTKVTAVAERDAAMPERVAAMQNEATASV